MIWSFSTARDNTTCASGSAACDIEGRASGTYGEWVLRSVRRAARSDVRCVNPIQVGVLLVVLVALQVAVANGDTLITKDGKRYTGQVVEEPDSFRVTVKTGITVRVPKGEVERVISAADAKAELEVMQESADLKNDDRLGELLQFASEHGLAEEQARLLAEAFEARISAAGNDIDALQAVAAWCAMHSLLAEREDCETRLRRLGAVAQSDTASGDRQSTAELAVKQNAPRRPEDIRGCIRAVNKVIQSHYRRSPWTGDWWVNIGSEPSATDLQLNRAQQVSVCLPDPEDPGIAAAYVVGSVVIFRPKGAQPNTRPSESPNLEAAPGAPAELPKGVHGCLDSIAGAQQLDGCWKVRSCVNSIERLDNGDVILEGNVVSRQPAAIESYLTKEERREWAKLLGGQRFGARPSADVLLRCAGNTGCCELLFRALERRTAVERIVLKACVPSNLAVNVDLSALDKLLGEQPRAAEGVVIVNAYELGVELSLETEIQRIMIRGPLADIREPPALGAIDVTVTKLDRKYLKRDRKP